MLKSGYGVINSDLVTDLWFCQLRQLLLVFFFRLDFSITLLRYSLELHMFSQYRVTELHHICIHGALHIQLVLSLVKGENIPHFSYFNLVFFVIQDNNDSSFSVWVKMSPSSWNEKRIATTQKELTLTFRNKIRIRNETDQIYFGLMRQSWLSFRHLTW